MAERKKYIVHKTNLKDDDGNKKGDGELVELGPELARRYGKLGFLRPYFDETEETDDDDDVTGMDEAAPKLARNRRVASGSASTTPLTGATTK